MNTSSQQAPSETGDAHVAEVEAARRAALPAASSLMMTGQKTKASWSLGKKGLD